MYTVVLLLHVLIAIALITLVLLQQGKGADAGAAFGSGASSTVFGSRGSHSFLSRITGALATGFFVTSLTLAYFLTQTSDPTSVTERFGTADSTIEQAVGEPPAGDLPSDVTDVVTPAPANVENNTENDADAPPSDVPTVTE